MAVLCNAVKLMVTLNIHFRDTTSHLLQLQQVAANMTLGEPLYVSLLALLHRNDGLIHRNGLYL